MDINKKLSLCEEQEEKVLNDWNDVKDILPEQFNGMCEHDYVLVISESAGPSPLYGLACRRDGEWDIFGGEGVHSCTGTYELRSEDITHWKML